MLPVTLTTILLVVMPMLTNGQVNKMEWAPEDMPNPVMQPRLCGHNSDDEAYICDPNRILGDDIIHINWHLKDAAYNSTECPCSNYYCETSRWGRALGYRIGVALVKRMKIQTSMDGSLNSKRDQGQLFAYTLENKAWKMGNCEEDVVIFYSVEDQILAIQAGSTAAMKLNKYYRHLIAYKVGSRLEEGRITEGLNNLIYDIKLVLNCDDPESDCGVHQLRSGTTRTALTVSLIFPAVLLALSSLMSF